MTYQGVNSRGIQYDAGLVLGFFYSKKVIRHLHFTIGVSYFKGSTWENYEGSLSNLSPSFQNSDYAVNFIEKTEHDFIYGAALVFPFTQIDFSYNGRINNYSLKAGFNICLLYTSPSPRDRTRSRMPSSA